MKIGEAYVELKANSAQLKTDFNAAESMTRAAVSRMSGYAKFAAFAAVGMFAKTAVGQALAFERQMANVSTMVDDTGRHMAKLTAGVRMLSKEFGEGTETMSKGLYDILSASVAAEKAIGVLRVSAQAAVAGLTSTAVSADVITTVLNSYQMDAREAERVSDVLFATVKRGKITFEELASSLGMVAATASIASVPLEEVSAYVSTVTRAGINAFQAVTSLQAVLLTFLSPSDSAAAAAKALGIELSGAALRAEGLLAILAKLRGLKPEEIASIFENKRAIKGVAAVLKDLDGVLKDHQGALKAAGATGVAFDKQAATNAHSLKKLGQEATDAAGRIGEFVLASGGFTLKAWDQSGGEAARAYANLINGKNLADFGNIGGRESAGAPQVSIGNVGAVPQTRAEYDLKKAIVEEYNKAILEKTREVHHEMDMIKRQSLAGDLRDSVAERDAILANIKIYEAKAAAIEKGREASARVARDRKAERDAWVQWKNIIFALDKFQLAGGVGGAVGGLMERFVGKIDPREVARRAREDEQGREADLRAIDDQVAAEKQLENMIMQGKARVKRAAGDAFGAEEIEREMAFRDQMDRIDAMENRMREAQGGGPLPDDVVAKFDAAREAAEDVKNAWGEGKMGFRQASLREVSLAAQGKLGVGTAGFGKEKEEADAAKKTAKNTDQMKKVLEQIEKKIGGWG